MVSFVNLMSKISNSVPLFSALFNHLLLSGSLQLGLFTESLIVDPAEQNATGSGSTIWGLRVEFRE
jgi:hypothetical protein